MRRGRRQRTGAWIFAAACLLGALVGCGGEEPPGEAPAAMEEEASAPVASAPPATLAPAAPTASAPALPTLGELRQAALESRAERLVRIAQQPIPAEVGVQATVLSMSLEEVPYRGAAGRREAGVSLKLSGVVVNRTGRTLSEGGVAAALALRFDGDAQRARLALDALKVAVTPEEPWRDGESRLFEATTEPFPRLMLEYAPLEVSAALVASLRDPVGFEVNAPIWRARPSWLAARVAPVKGEAQVFRADPLVVGPRKKAAGKLREGEVVRLLYQAGAHLRVQAAEGVGWVEARALVVKQPEALYEGAAPPPSTRAASNPEGALRVHALRTLEQAPAALKLQPGERALQVEVELTNTSDKDLRCSELFVDFGPGSARGALKGAEAVEGALACEKDKVAPGQTLRGWVTWARGRLEIPVVVGWSTRSGVLLVDVYDPADAAAWRR